MNPVIDYMNPVIDYMNPVIDYIMYDIRTRTYRVDMLKTALVPNYNHSFEAVGDL